MSPAIRLHEIPPSPNNIKVRIALGYKQLEYERVPLTLEQYPGDRTEIIRVSRQPLTPVLVHGDHVMFDSASILRYLEANFPEAPPLFSGDWETMRAIEEWERMGRYKFSDPVSIIFDQAGRPEKDAGACRRASDLMHDLSGAIESELAQRPYLLTDHPTAGDVTVAPYVFLAMLPPEAAQNSPIAGFFQENLFLGDGRDRTREWVMRMMAYDEDRPGATS